MDSVQKKPQIPILLFLLTFANVLGILYTAALPELTLYFQITKGQAQSTISFFLVGCMLGQIIYAPIANALGRKPALYIGGAIVILGSFLCLISIAVNSFYLLLFARILTAFGAACGLVLTNTMIADAFTHLEVKKKLSYLMSGFAIFPAISITLGGFITKYFSWKGCFYFMFFYSCFVIGLCIFLPETVKMRSLSHLRISQIAKSYIKQFYNVRFPFYALIVACGSIILYVFSAEAPFIAKTKLHISPDRFGLYNLIPNIGLFLGGIASARLSHKIPSRVMIFIGSSSFFLLSIVMWLFFEGGFVNIFTLFVMPLFIFFVTPAILSNGQSLALAISEDKSYASSSLYIIQFSWVFLSITVLRFFSPGNSSALPIVYSAAGLLMVLFWIVLKMLPLEKHQNL